MANMNDPLIRKANAIYKKKPGVRKAMVNHVLSFYKGKGGRTALIRNIEKEGGSAFDVGVDLAYGMALADNEEQVRLLKRLHLLTPRAAYLYYHASDAEISDAWGSDEFQSDLYNVLVGLAFEDIYKEYMRKHLVARKPAVRTIRRRS